MAPRTRLLLLLFLLALGMWWLVSRGTGSHDVAAPQGRRASAAGQGPVLEATLPRPTIGADGNPLRAEPASDGTPSTASVRVHGRVVLPEGYPAGVGVVWLLELEEDYCVLKRQALADGLTFDWSVPCNAQFPTHAWRVSVLVPGLCRRERDHDVTPGVEIHEEFAWSQEELEAPLLEGRLTDIRGRPLEGLNIAFSSLPAHTLSDDNLPHGVGDLLDRGPNEGLLVVTTGLDGRFTARTETPTPLWPILLDGRWIVVDRASGSGFSHGDPSLKIQAHPAMRVHGHVRDARTGRPIEDHVRKIAVRGGENTARSPSGYGSRADFEWACPVPTVRAGLVEIVVQVSAPLYEPFETRLYPGPDGLEETLDIALRPLGASEIGELVVLSDVRNEQGLRLGTELWEWRPVPLAASRLHAELPEPGDVGVVFRMAGGTRHALLTLEDDARVLCWRGELTVVGGSRTTFRVPWPPHGSLRLRHRPWGEDEPRPTFQLSHEVHGRSGFLQPEWEAPETLFHLPVGTWCVADLDQTPTVSHTVEIAEGVETVFEIER